MDGRILRATRTTSLAGNRECRRKESVSAQSRTMRCAGQKPPGDLRVYFHPKPPLGSFTKAMGPGRTDPSWHSGNTHGFASQEESRRLLRSQPRRLGFGCPHRARPRHGICKLTCSGKPALLKPELSTLLTTGSFYFALTGILKAEKTRKSGIRHDEAPCWKMRSGSNQVGISGLLFASSVRSAAPPG
jgi:hypothetical protein